MRVYILSNDDLTSNLIFAPLFKVKGLDIAGIAFAASVSKGSTSELGGALALRAKMAGRYWNYLTFTNGCFRLFEWLTLKLGLEPCKGALGSLRALARQRGVPVSRCANFNAPDFVDGLAALNLDLLLIRVGAILDEPILDLPEIGTWCVHSSLLPALGGIAGEFHALRLGLPIGSTVFMVTTELDRGPPLAQILINRRERGSVFTHMITNNQKAGELLASMLKPGHEHKLYNENLSQSYFSWPQEAHLDELRARGHPLIGWREALHWLTACLRLRKR